MLFSSVPKDHTVSSHYSSVYFCHQCPGYVHPTDETHGFFSSIALENRLLHSRLLYLWTLLSLLKPFPPLLHDTLTPFSPILNWNQLSRPLILLINLVCFTSPGPTSFFKCRILNQAQLKALQTLTLVWGLFLVPCRLHSSLPTLRHFLAHWDSCAPFVTQHFAFDVGQGLLPTGAAASSHLSRLSTQFLFLLQSNLKVKAQLENSNCRDAEFLCIS